MKTPFFIVGLGRSGTTLLRLMLHKHPKIAIPYETHFVTDYHEKLDQYGDILNKENRQKLLRDILNEDLIKQWDHKFDIDQLLERPVEPGLGGVFKSIYEDYALAKGKDRWGDKSDYLDRMHIIHEIFPDAKFIHIIRDGRDVANSVMKMDWGPNDIIQAAEWWHNHIILGRRMGSILGKEKYTEVKFEDLIANAEAELKRLCDFIGEEYYPEMLNFYEASSKAIPDARKDQHHNTDKPLQSSRTCAWKSEMSELDVAIFDTYAKYSLAEVGYEIPKINVNKYRLLASKATIFFKRALES